MNNTLKQLKRITKLKRLKKTFLLAGLLLLIGVTAKAQTYYVFYNATYGYIYNSGTTPSVSTTFTKSAIWAASGTLGNTTRNIYSYTATTQFMRGGTDGTALTLGNYTTTWRLRDNVLNYNNNRNGYVHYNGSSLVCSNGNTRFTPYNITINNQAVANPTISITAASGLSNGGIQLTGTVTGTYAPACNSAVVRNYNANSTQTYYWTSSTEASTTRPGQITDWSDATKTWAVTTGGTYASVSSDGLVTITGNPTGNVVVTLTVSKGGYTGTQTFTLTRAAIAQNVVSETAITGPTISPAAAALYYNEGSQTFTSSASATTTTTTIPAHTTFTGGGTTYYYYNGTLYDSTDDFSFSTEAPSNVTLTWSLNGDAASYLTRTPETGTSTTVTHSTQAPSDLTATLTVTASAAGATPKTATATITAYGPMVAPTITRTGNTIILSTTNIGATIYYTTDGTTPSASNGTAYTGPFNLVTSPTTVKAIVIRDGNSSEVTTKTLQIQLPTPVITISNTGLATITLGEGSPDGTTIHYTTNGNPPTESSSTYSSAVQLVNPQTIKAIAVKTGYDNSEIATGDYISSGISNGKVILDDREDHSWSYYSDASLPAQLHSLSPADVKITYYGNGIMMTGTADYTASSTDFVQYGNANYIGGAKVNVGGEDENTFVYYKTLERGADTDATWTFSASNQSSDASR